MRTILTLLVLSAAPEPSLTGRWIDGDRGVVSEFTRGADGTWSAVVVASRFPTDVGKTTFRALRWDPRAGHFSGKLLKPDDDQVFDFDLSVVSSTELKGTAGVFIFRKTLTFRRVTAPDGGP
jgi:uncharacterized protein (DUF2147 family)